MENKKIKELCGSINYNTYNKILNSLGTSSVGITSIGIILAGGYLPQYSMLTIPMCTLGGISFLTYLHILDFDGQYYTKDLKKIKELYQEFIKNYIRLNKIFDLNNPIQIHTMFNFLVYGGYLSKDKKFEFSDKQARDIKGINGADVITGKGVCRHINPMFTDILNAYGIESGNLTVYCKDYIIDTPNLQIENIFAKRNHIITFAFKDEEVYFLDPSECSIYRISESNKNKICDDIYEIFIRLKDSKEYNSLEDYLRMKERLAGEYPNFSAEKEKTMVKETRKICWANLDIFEQFYQENRELYNDISSKVLKIQKKYSSN